MALFDKLKSKLGIGRTENPAEPDKKEEKAVPEAPKTRRTPPMRRRMPRVWIPRRASRPPRK